MPIDFRAVSRVLLTGLAPLCLTACDTVYGINSGKTVSRSATSQCIVDALNMTPGIRDVRLKTVAYDGWSILGEGSHHGSAIQYFSYDIGEDYFPTLMIEDYGASKYHFSDTMLSMNRRIPQPVIDKAFPIMLAAEKQVSQHCELEIDAGMNHECDGSVCGRR